MSTTDQDTQHDTHLYDPDRHDNQIVAVFEDRAAAAQAEATLVAAGVAQDTIRVIDQPSTKPDSTVGDQVLNAFMGLFSAGEEHTDYAHAVSQGHALLTVTPGPEADRQGIVALLEQSGPIDFDAKLEAWRQAGYKSPTGGTPDVGNTTGRRDPTASTSRVRTYLTDRP